MEIAWLKDFVMLSQMGVFARAAEKRNVTQPAFTRRIKRLESALGVDIIDRSVHPIALTAAGAKFLPTAQNMIYEWERSRSELSEAGERPETLRIATLQSLSVSYLPRFVKEIFPNANGPYFHVVADDFASCIEAIISGDVDALLCYSHEEIPTGDHVLHRPSYKIGTDWLIPISKSQQQEPIYSLDDAAVPFLTYGSVGFLGRISSLMLERSQGTINLRPVYQDSLAASLKAAALAGLGVAWLPQALVETELLTGDLINISGGNPDYEVPLTITFYEGRSAEARSNRRFWKKVRGLSDQLVAS